MSEKMKISDFQMYKTIFELALVNYEAEMQGLNPDPRERYIESISGVKAIEPEKSKAEIIGNLKRKIPLIFKSSLSVDHTVIVKRHFDALEALSEDEKATLTPDELDRRWAEYVSSLDDAERAILENEPQRLESSLRSAIEELSCQAEGKYLEILVEAVKRNIDRQKSRGEEPVLLDHEGRPLLLLADLLDKDRKALRLLEECLLDRPVVLEAEQPEELAANGKIPGGFVGFCYREIETMPTEERDRFLSVNRGDSSFFHYRNAWNKKWRDEGNTLYKKPQEGISKAKKIYRELHKELKN